MDSSCSVRRPHVRGTSRTLVVEDSVYWEVRELGRSQSFGIFDATESRFDFARACQSAMGGVDSITIVGLWVWGEGLTITIDDV